MDRGSKGTIAAGHELTATAGLEMLAAGGNAFDAAVAACFASFVCESALTSAGGGGFFMVSVRGEEPVLYDFFTNVPGRTADMAVGGDVDFFPVHIRFADTMQELHIGEGAAAVPGCIAGLSEVYERHCTLPLKALMAPAIKYAKAGIELSSEQAGFAKLLEPMLTVSEEGRAVYAPEGRMLVEGERIYNQDMAYTFEYLAQQGLGAFYQGPIAESILDGFGKGRGLITALDLTNYRVAVRRPLKTSYRGRSIYTNPLPSSGGCLIAFALKLFESIEPGAFPHNSAAYLRLLCDVMRVTETARASHLDHRVYEEGAGAGFLSDNTVDKYRQILKKGLPKEVLNSPSTSSTPSSSPRGPGNTTQISVIDCEGNAAGVTTSTGIGCGFMIPGTGIMMNNMLGEEDLNPQGFHKHPPSVRLSSMMAPTLVLRDGLPEIVLGSGGSKRIRSAILQVLVNIIDHSMTVRDAVFAPRVHWDGRLLQAEGTMAAAELSALEKGGVPVHRWSGKHMYFGGVNTVTVDDDAKIRGAGDPRRGGVSVSGR